MSTEIEINHLVAKLEQFNIDPSSYPHGSNLLTKAKSKSSQTASRQKALLLALPAYLDLHSYFIEYERGALTLSILLDKTEAYYDLIKTKDVNKFSPFFYYSSIFRIFSFIFIIVSNLLISTCSHLKL